MATYKSYDFDPDTPLPKGYQGRSPYDEYMYGGDNAYGFNSMRDQFLQPHKNRKFSALPQTDAEKQAIINQSWIRNKLPVPGSTIKTSLAPSNQQMMEMANDRGQAGQKRTTGAKTPPNWKDNLLNYVLSPKGQGMAQGLLEASGYSTTPISFGQALAMGMQRGTEAETAAAASQLAKDKLAYQKSQDLITNLLAQQGLDIEGKKIKPQETFEQIEIEVPDGKGGTMTVQANKSLLTGKVTPVMSGGGTKITVGGDTSDGFKKVNTTYATEFTNWNLTGGFAVAKENIGKINDVLKVLAEKNVTGKYTGLQPKWMRSFTNPDSVSIEDDIESIIFQSLKQTLGAQFTENEAKRLIQTSFNIRLDEKVNIKRLERMRDKILAMAKAKEKAAQYFKENNGDMSDYDAQVDFGFDNDSNETLQNATMDDLLESTFKVEDYEGLDEKTFTEYYKNADRTEKLWILKNADKIPQIQIETGDN